MSAAKSCSIVPPLTTTRAAGNVVVRCCLRLASTALHMGRLDTVFLSVTMRMLRVVLGMTWGAAR